MRCEIVGGWKNGGWMAGGKGKREGERRDNSVEERRERRIY